MPAQNDIFAIIVVFDEWGFNETTAPQMRDLIVHLKPDYFEYDSPNGFTIYLRGKNRPMKDRFVAEITTHLKGIPIVNAGIGVCEGDLIFETTPFGRIKSSPLGDAINRAHKNAHENKETKVQSRWRR